MIAPLQMIKGAAVVTSSLVSVFIGRIFSSHSSCHAGNGKISADRHSSGTVDYSISTEPQHSQYCAVLRRESSRHIETWVGDKLLQKKNAFAAIYVVFFTYVIKIIINYVI